MIVGKVAYPIFAPLAICGYYLSGTSSIVVAPGFKSWVLRSMRREVFSVRLNIKPRRAQWTQRGVGEPYKTYGAYKPERKEVEIASLNYLESCRDHNVIYVL
jgi:hypothetical protein